MKKYHGSEMPWVVECCCLGGGPLRAWAVWLYFDIFAFYVSIYYFVALDHHVMPYGCKFKIYALLFVSFIFWTFALFLVGMRPAELFFQMHLVSRQSSDSSSSVEPYQSPLKWIIRAIHLNPSCLRYWKVLHKFME